MSPAIADNETFTQIAARLRGDYGQRRTPEQIDTAVTAALDHFSDSRLRAFVPVLAERRARAALESTAA
ncbi:three-helix bundle dimerization domain-containing protein [Streptacidiphilus sp. PAMC 29251]